MTDTLLLMHDPHELYKTCDELRSAGNRIGLVPTMGALHEGHLSLVDAVREAGATKVILTIFVNPTQFGPKEDFSKYPRTLDSDLVLCRERNVDVVWAPVSDSMYPVGFETHVEVENLTKEYEGRFRPTHFRGVTTVVTKLFNRVGPCVAAFGRKDYQQWRVLERMAKDLDMPVQVIGSPTVRERDGLAMSSRNRYLNAPDRKRALAIYRGLCAASGAFTDGERSPAVLERLVREPVETDFDRIDYIAIADPVDLTPCQNQTGEAAVILVAAHMGTTRLLDNTVLGEEVLTVR